MNCFFLHISSFVFAFFFTFYLIKIVFKVAKKYSIIDFPDGYIKNQKEGVPYLGGLAIFLSFILVLALFYPFKNFILGLILGIVLLLFVGLLDDLIIFNPLQKFLGQILAVICFLRGGLILKETFFSDFWTIFISGFWMLLVINAFNLVDVMDGLATILAIISASSFFVIALLMKQYFLSLLILTLIAPLIVFFIYNKPSAKIYMGDCGSLFLGGFFAAIPLFFSWSCNNAFGFFVPLVILGVPLFEVIMLILIRTYLGIPFYKGSPHHFSSFLLSKNWSKNRILILVSIFSLILSVFSILFLFNFINLISFGSAVVIIFLFWACCLFC